MLPSGSHGIVGLMPGRRDLLALLGATVAGMPRQGRAAQSPASLAAAAASRGLRYGAAPFSYPPAFSPAYDELVAQQCALIAPVLNWRIISPAPSKFIEGTDRGVVDFARAHGLQLTGAHLLWHEALPAWFGSLQHASGAHAAIEQHVSLMGRHYADVTWSVNVVNEALSPTDDRPDGLRDDHLSRLLGSTYPSIAFRAARAAFPHAYLLYNDYGMEQDAGDMQKRRQSLLARIDEWQAARVPIDGIGLQAHLSLARSFDPDSYCAFLEEIAARGLRIVITELDVLDAAVPAAIGPRDQAVAALYARYLQAALSNASVAAVVTWGLSDRYTWLTPETGPSFARTDGVATRPLPFDAAFRPKPAFEAIRSALSSCPMRALSKV
ncbi:MAG: endo-1,4-beta-xylanase [Acetobacteraceae bacterium]|nr:endo-1,4-beta-xylanase [Acetobacteraceae bacterium]